MKQLEIIGEAANRVTEETRKSNQDIEWSKIIALRNILVHEYFITMDELPDLKVQIEGLITRTK